MVRFLVSGSHASGGAPWPTPYPGWRPFGRADADRFFGRYQQAAAVARLWQENRLTVLHGPAAVGKTSLLAAGVLPLLDVASDDVASDGASADLVVLPIADLMPTTAGEPAPLLDRNPSSFAMLQAWAHAEGTSIRSSSFSDFLLSRRDQVETPGRPRRVLAAIDHFDWIFDAPDDERETLIGELAAAVRRVPELNLLLIIDDGTLQRFRLHQARLLDSQVAFVELGPLMPGDALAAVNGPLAGSGHAFQEDAAAEFVAALGAAGDCGGEHDELAVEPLLLQLACEELWSRLSPADEVITSDLLRYVGDIGTALSHFYDSSVQAASRVTRVPENELRGWVEHAFVDPHGMPRSAPRESGLIDGMAHRVINVLAERHFLALERSLRRSQCRLTLAAMASVVREVNQMWRSVSVAGALDYTPEAIQPDAYAAAARDALAEGNLLDAQSLAVRATELFRLTGKERQLAHALMLRGDIARARGDLSYAEDNFREALSHFSALQDRNHTASTLSALGEVRAMEGDFQRAEEFQRLAVDTLPTDIAALIGLGYAQWYGGSPANAEATFTQALAWDAAAPLAISGRGQVRAELREYGAALADLDRALSSGLAPDDETDARSARALALAGLGRAEEAERELAVARGRAQRARTLLRSARVAAIAGRDEEAVRELERALAARPPLSTAEEKAARRMRERLTGRSPARKVG